ncbi:MAG: hypothetical protein M1834_009424 [Cirrosporium novae-zelandiae]|nr:MAG: hypothetical protein M1834_009424 [Cirrosporium novae-zelandiae]
MASVTESERESRNSISHDSSEEDLASSAYQPSSEDQDLTSFLSPSQCADLTLLVANITEVMRNNILNNFNAAALLDKDLLDDQPPKSEDERIMNTNFDTGTVDVEAYDREKKIKAEREKELSSHKAKELKKAALKFFDEWREGVISRIGEVVNSKQTISQQKEEAKNPTTEPNQPRAPTTKVNPTMKGGEKSAPRLEEIFPRVRTPLTKLSIPHRAMILHSTLLLLLSLEHYNASSRVLLLYMASSLKLSIKALRSDEEKVAQGLLAAVKTLSADEEAQKRAQTSKHSRKWKVGLASVAGAAIIGVTGGLAAPLVAAGVGTVMGGLGLGATAAAGYLGTVAGSTVIVGGLFGAYGGRMTGKMMDSYAREVEDFAFLPVHGSRESFSSDDDPAAASQDRRLRVTIGITGWLTSKEQIVTPWKVLGNNAEVFALRWELEALMNLGNSIESLMESAAWGYAKKELIAHTIFAELAAALWPIGLLKVSRVVDNPFSVAKSRADKAGAVLADALINRAQGERPVTLIGYSLGARVIYSCLMALAKRHAFGLVESAVLIGSPCPSEISTWRMMRAVVSGRLVNVFSENDYVLGFLYRTSSIQFGIAGLQKIEGLPGVENVDVSEHVSGHLRYRYLVGSILQKLGFEDVDKEEVKKEEEAFQELLQKEKEQDYIRKAKNKGRGYIGRDGKDKDAPSRPSTADGKEPTEIKDGNETAEIKDDDSEVKEMENAVRQKTQKSLMQWATEQLYISKPKVNTKKEVSGAEKQQVPDTTTTTQKSYYERAKEQLHLKRSGAGSPTSTSSSPDREKVNEAKHDVDTKTKSATGAGGYLSAARGYMPSWKKGGTTSPKNGQQSETPPPLPDRPPSNTALEG